MKVRIGSETRTGRAIDLSDASLSPNAVVDVVRGGADESLAIDCSNPSAMHQHVGLIDSQTSVRTRTALAAVARCRGVTTPQDDEIAALERKLNSMDVPDVSLESERRHVANTSGSETELRERVAALRGQVQAMREAGLNPADAETSLREATRKLSETETERIAAEQTLERARERQRSARDQRAKRLHLRDRKENLERTARRRLARSVREEFADAVEQIPGTGRVTDAGAFEGDSVTEALAIARIAPLRAPIVLACSRFETPVEASECLGAPVLQI